ncbi:hypothetical protein H0H81_005301 [Sphagnurus paluster]|uniref:Dihydrofolate reductase n=1 Tax=Sphagnurus paluster TaxID=117069 RepID=A0A9P7FV65_9AGAR|nr:hypothetical protein H0H81_005301 [Sphagnurus paluster]
MLGLTIIVAATKSNGIGKNSGLPWRLAKEMKYFAQVTTNAPEGYANAVVMGRNTWESIPKMFRPLPRRVNIVISGNNKYEVYVVPDLTEINDAIIHSEIRGRSIYAEALDLSATSNSLAVVDRVLLTRIVSPDFDDCDVFMPDFLKDDESTSNKWERASHSDLEEWVGFKVPQGVQKEDGVEYEFQMWTRPT